MKKPKDKPDLGGIETLYSNIPNYYISSGETGSVQHSENSDALLHNAVQAEGTVPVVPSIPAKVNKKNKT